MSRNPDRDPLETIVNEVRKVIDRYYSAGDGIESTEVADKVAYVLDPPPSKSPATMYLVAHQGLIQIAGRELRRRAGAPLESPEQVDAFANTLQDMYPIARATWGKKKYLQRDLITREEWQVQVIDYFDKIGRAYFRHRDLAIEWAKARTDWPENPVGQLACVP